MRYMFETGQSRNTAALKTTISACFFNEVIYINDIEKKLYELLLIAYEENEVPVAAVVECDGEIVSYAYNKTNEQQRCLLHAEVIAIDNAQKKLGKWRLNDCVLHISMEPCLMCYGLIINSRIKKVNYYVENSKFGFSNEVLKNKMKNSVIKNELSYNIERLLKNFFEERR